MLFSATRSDATKALIRSAMKENVQSISLTQDDDRATVEGLKQGYAISFSRIVLKSLQCTILLPNRVCTNYYFFYLKKYTVLLAALYRYPLSRIRSATPPPVIGSTGSSARQKLSRKMHHCRFSH